MNKRRLRILISSFGFVNGGGYQRTFKLAKELAYFGHDVTFLTSQKKSYTFPYKITWLANVKEVAFFDLMPIKAKQMGLSPLAAVLKTLFVLNKRYDIVFSDAGHRISGGLPAWIHKRLFKTTYISEWWDYYGRGGQYDSKPITWRYSYGLIDNWLEIKDKKIANGIIALSQYTTNRAIKYGVNPSNIAVINGGADIDQIHFVSDKRFRQVYGLKDTDFVIVLCGISGSLDFGPLLSIIPKLIMTTSVNIRLVTTGRKLPESVIKKYDLNNILFQFGWVDYTDYYKVLSLADCFFLYQNPDKANKAKWPNKIGDYLSAGRVIFTNPLNDVSKLMEEQNHAILAFDTNPESILEILKKAIMNRRDILRLGQKNRILAEKHSWQKKAKELEAFFLKMLGEKV